MRINNNLMAMNTHRQLGINNTNMGKSIEKLSSGLRINRAGDDAAGLSISEKMRGQIRGLDQASRNSQDGISMIQTAEGALNETHSILQRMKELATQAANDTNTVDDRKEIQKEMNQLTSEINRIGNTTEFNTQKVLKGGAGATPATGAVGSVTNPTPYNAGSVTPATGTLTFSGASLNGETAVVNGFTFNFATIPADADSAGNNWDVALGGSAKLAGDAFETAFNAAKADGATQLANLTVTNDGSGGITITDTTGANTATLTETLTNGAVSGATLAGGSPASPTEAVFNVSVTTPFAAGDSITIGTETFTFGAGVGEVAIGADADATVANLKTAITAGTTYDATGTGQDIVLTQKTAAAGAAPTVTVSGPSITEFNATLQIGASQGQSFEVKINDMRASELGISGAAEGTAEGAGSDVVSGATFAAVADTDELTDNSGTTEYALDVTSNTKASAAIKVLDQAIAKVSSERSKLGAYQNRLEHTINNLNTSSENLTSAESRIRDVDMAKEMMEQSKNSILSQASQAMLAQAKQAPQGVLQLLR